MYLTNSGSFAKLIFVYIFILNVSTINGQVLNCRMVWMDVGTSQIEKMRAEMFGAVYWRIKREKYVVPAIPQSVIDKSEFNQYDDASFLVFFILGSV